MATEGRVRSWRSEREQLMPYAAPCFVELVVAASRDERSRGLPIQVKDRAATEYFRFHPASAGYSYDDDGPVPLPPTFSGNINGNMGARQTGRAEEAALIRPVEGRSPKAWSVVDAHGAAERFPTTMPIPESLTIEVRRGVAVVDRPALGPTLLEIPEDRPTRSGWSIRYGSFRDDEPSDLSGPTADVDVDDFSVYVATNEALIAGTAEHARLVDAARAALEAVDPVQGIGGDLMPDLAWNAESGWVVAEVKTLGAGSEDVQIRLGLGQVIQYRWQEAMNRPGRPVLGVLVVSRKPSGPWREVCASVDVQLHWPPFDFGHLAEPPGRVAQ